MNNQQSFVRSEVIYDKNGKRTTVRRRVRPVPDMEKLRSLPAPVLAIKAVTDFSESAVDFAAEFFPEENPKKSGKGWFSWLSIFSLFKGGK